MQVRGLAREEPIEAAMLPKRKQLVRICIVGLVFGFFPEVWSQEDAGEVPPTPSTPFKRGWRKEGQELKGPWSPDVMGVRQGDSSWRRAMERLSMPDRPRDSPRYVVLAPTVVRPESVYGVVVGVLGGAGVDAGTGGAVNVRASLTTPSQGQVTQAEEKVTPGTFTTIYMKIPGDVGGESEGRGQVRVEGHRGTQLVFVNATQVAISPRFLTILVQMSRPIYTGSQTVEFRVVLLKTDLRPYQGPVNIYILDSDGYVLKRWLSRFPSTGLVELSLGTPGLPKPGWWRVKVEAGSQIHHHPFFITKFFPPRFEVLVEVPYSTVAGSGGLSGRFGAFYLTYSPLPTSANLTVYLKSHWSLPNSAFRKVFTDYVPLSEGWQEFEYPLESLAINSTVSGLVNAEVKVEVTVRHTFLGDIHTGHARTRIVAPEVRVTFVGSEPLIFKPGMSLTAAVGVSYEDGEPLTPRQLRQSTLTLTPSLTRAEGGTTSLPQIVVRPPIRRSPAMAKVWSWGGNGSSTTHMRAVWAGPSDINLAHHRAFLRFQRDGILQFTLDIPEDATGLEVTASYHDASSGVVTSGRVSGQPVHSPEGRLLHITSSPGAKVAVGEFAVFHVRANFPMDWYRYLVMAKGLLIHSGTERVEWMGSEVVSTLSLAVSRDMSPRFTMAVLHVTPSGHVLVDTIHVAVTLPTSDKVEVVLNQDKDHSKRTVEASMHASPGTHLALSCTRWPSWTAHHSSRITRAAVLTEALTMEPHPRPVHTVRQVSRSGEWTERVASLTTESTAAWPLAALHLAGLTCLTDAVLSTPPHAGSCDHQLGWLECGDGSCYRQSEVCDGHTHCHNAADELHCLSLNKDFQPSGTMEGRLKKTPEVEEAEFRLTHRSWWRDLFDQKEGSWCRTRTHFGHKGYERVDLTVPNSPGLWVVEGFAIHPHHGLHILPEQLYDATPPLLMRIEGPPVCRRGEQISLRVHLHNALNHTVMVMVVMGGSADYRFVHVEGDASVSHFWPRLSKGDHQHLVTIGSGGWQEVMLPLAVMRQSGKFKVVVKAVSQLHTRTAVHRVNVKPEGAVVAKHTSVLLDLKSRAMVYEYMDLPQDQSPIITNSILRRFIYGSPQATLTLSGDVFGPVQKTGIVSFVKAFRGRILKSSDGLAFNFGTTLWTLHYLRLTRQLTPRTTKQAFKFLNVQLAGLLTRFRDGGFKMWHFSKPSVWVTAWVLNVLLGAQLEDWENLVYIEPRMVSACVAFLLRHQDPQGGFHETVHHVNETLAYTMSFKGWSAGNHSTSSGGDGEPLVALTALIVTVLHEALPTLTGKVHTDAINAKFRAVALLERLLEQLWDPYEVAITTYALTLVDSPEKDVAFYKLMQMEVTTPDGKIHWSREPIYSNVRLSQDNQRNFISVRTKQAWDSYAVEASSYGLLTVLLREGIVGRAERIMKWINSVRNWNFAFIGTVDTVVAMRALAEYSYRARLQDVTRMQVRVESSATPDIVHSLTITNNSIAAFTSFRVARPWGHVSLKAKGSGQAISQLDMTWGVDLDRYLEKPPRKYFDLTVMETFPSLRNKSIIATRVCVRWTATDLAPTSHAAFLMVDVATGYFLSQPESNRAVRKAQAGDVPMLIDVKATPVAMYWQFMHVPSDRLRCFNYEMRRQHPAANLTAVREATIYELFAPEHFQTVVINASTLAVLDICEVCGSYQCPYCPSYSGRASPILPHPPLILLLLILILLVYPNILPTCTGLISVLLNSPLSILLLILILLYPQILTSSTLLPHTPLIILILIYPQIQLSSTVLHMLPKLLLTVIPLTYPLLSPSTATSILSSQFLLLLFPLMNLSVIPNSANFTLSPKLLLLLVPLIYLSIFPNITALSMDSQLILLCYLFPHKSPPVQFNSRIFPLFIPPCIILLSLLLSPLVCSSVSPSILASKLLPPSLLLTSLLVLLFPLLLVQTSDFSPTLQDTSQVLPHLRLSLLSLLIQLTIPNILNLLLLPSLLLLLLTSCSSSKYKSKQKTNCGMKCKK